MPPAMGAMVHHRSPLLLLLLVMVMVMLPQTVVGPSIAGRRRELSEQEAAAAASWSSEDGSVSQHLVQDGLTDPGGLPLEVGLLITAVLLGLLLCSCFFGSEPAAARRDSLKQGLPGAQKRADAIAIGRVPDDESSLTEMSAITRGTSAGSLSEVTMSDISARVEHGTLNEAGSVKPLAGLPGRESVEVESTPLRVQSSTADLSGISAYETPYPPSAMGGSATTQARRRDADPTPELVSGQTLAKRCHSCA
eukprot:COSAG02_NODE_597_length_19775_cov_28.914312_16_plen_251_part_00